MSIDSPRKTEQVPHSKNFGPAPETPYKEFDKTPLEDALHLIQTPKHAGELLDSPNKKRLSRRNKVIATAASVAVAASAAVGVSIASNQTPNNEPVAEAPADQGQEVVDGGTVNNGTETENIISGTNQTVEHDPIIDNPQEKEAAIESMRIKANGSPEEKANAIVNIFDRTNMSGATPELIATDMKNALEGVSPQSDDLAYQVAANQADAGMQAYYGENLLKLPGVLDAQISNTSSNLIKYMTTFSSDEYPNTNALNEEAFTTSFINTKLEGYAGLEESSDELNGTFLNMAQATFKTEDITIINLSTIMTNNALKTSYRDNPTFEADNNKKIYMQSVLVPDGKGNLIAVHSETSDQPITAVDYQPLNQ